MNKVINKSNETLDLTREKIVFSLLQQVFLKGAYSSIALDDCLNKLTDERSKPYITMLFYGVLDKSIQFDYIISKLCSSKPKPQIIIILKMGLYLLRYSNTPSYAAVNKLAELTKAIGKGALVGFVNAVLKKSINIILPSSDDALGLSINSSTPLWLISTLNEQFVFEFTKQMLLYNSSTSTHIRHNGFKLKRSEFEEKYPYLKQNATKYGYYVTHNTLCSMEKSDYVVQSLASCIVSNAYFNQNDKSILDLCAAPGGKSVHLKQMHFENDKDVDLISCDIHPHRVRLIESYSKAVGCKLNIMQNDATVFCPEFEKRFDLVICDVPCSGLGVIGSKPDIAFFKSEDDIQKLKVLQSQILSVASTYVKNGGRLCYSTCTVLKDENDFVIEEFLSNNPAFKLNKPYLKLFPHIDNCDGFFLAELIKVN